MRFEWDAKKNRQNLKKHGISFDLAKEVFDDSYALSDPDRDVEGEERWCTIGVIRGSVTVLIAHTYRVEDGEEIIRIISARRAASAERRAYEEGRRPPR